MDLGNLSGTPTPDEMMAELFGWASAFLIIVGVVVMVYSIDLLRKR